MVIVNSIACKIEFKRALMLKEHILSINIIIKVVVILFGFKKITFFFKFIIKYVWCAIIFAGDCNMIQQSKHIASLFLKIMGIGFHTKFKIKLILACTYNRCCVNPILWPQLFLRHTVYYGMLRDGNVVWALSLFPSIFWSATDNNSYAFPETQNSREVCHWRWWDLLQRHRSKS